MKTLEDLFFHVAYRLHHPGLAIVGVFQIVVSVLVAWQAGVHETDIDSVAYWFGMFLAAVAMFTGYHTLLRWDKFRREDIQPAR